MDGSAVRGAAAARAIAAVEAQAVENGGGARGDAEVAIGARAGINDDALGAVTGIKGDASGIVDDDLGSQ